MSDWPALGRFLAADPRDVGCEQALQILDVYVEMVLEDAPGLAARRFPGVAVHLAACDRATKTSRVCSPRPEPPEHQCLRDFGCDSPVLERTSA